MDAMASGDSADVLAPSLSAIDTFSVFLVGVHDYIFATLLHLIQVIVGVHDYIYLLRCYICYR
jgi:hypothetical protein